MVHDLFCGFQQLKGRVNEKESEEENPVAIVYITETGLMEVLHA